MEILSWTLISFVHDVIVVAVDFSVERQRCFEVNQEISLLR